MGEDAIMAGSEGPHGPGHTLQYKPLYWINLICGFCGAKAA